MKIPIQYLMMVFLLALLPLLMLIQVCFQFYQVRFRQGELMEFETVYKERCWEIECFGGKNALISSLVAI